MTQAEVLRLQQQLKADTKAITGLISVIFKRDLACNFNDVGFTAEAAMRQAKSDAERAGAGTCLHLHHFCADILFAFRQRVAACVLTVTQLTRQLMWREEQACRRPSAR